jgi:hypothetical protein
MKNIYTYLNQWPGSLMMNYSAAAKNRKNSASPIEGKNIIF